MAEIVRLPKAVERSNKARCHKPGAGAEIVIFPGVRYEQREAVEEIVEKPRRTGPRKRRS